jgi:hypothetical protein
MSMKTLVRALMVLGVVGAGGLVGYGQSADTNSVAVTVERRDGQVVLPGSEVLGNRLSPLAGVRPERLERVNLPEDVRQRLLEFEKLRESYLAQQREMLSKLRGATDQDRARIREQIRESRETWLEQARRFRQEAQRRLEDLRSQLPGHREALDAARERAEDASKAVRERPRR